MSIRPATLLDIPSIRHMAVSAGMFPETEVDWVDAMLPAAVSGEAADDQWFVHDDDGVNGAMYFAPEPHGAEVWNVFFLVVDPAAHGRGVGRALMAHAEAVLAAMGPERARVVLVETSSTEAYAGARSFYARIGYTEEARIRGYYGTNDDKVVFWKALEG